MIKLVGWTRSVDFAKLGAVTVKQENKQTSEKKTISDVTVDVVDTVSHLLERNENTVG
tara:strand:- start:61 stop:234 length:174 start_codon:yes stop_codon:yes gene_type:complete